MASVASRRRARKERRRDEVREEILDASRKVILARGLGGFTLAAIARELQLTKAALYYYFASKEALVFELVFQGLERHAERVGKAVAKTRTGSDALEAMIREAAAYYGERKEELRLSYLVPQAGGAIPRFGPDMLERIRPLNDQIFGAVAERIAADVEAGRAPAGVDGRRLAFVAHTAVIGILTMEGLVEVADDGPLLHPRAAMIDELVASFTARLR